MYNANYMDGVPVKIAEKYKPPPEIYKLPQSLVNKLNLDDNFYENSTQYKYDMQLEQKALSKIDEWKHIRQRNKDARRERKAKRDLQRQEDEKRQKNLLMCVSYPSADDLSSSGSDDEGNTMAEAAGGNSKETTTITNTEQFPEICVTKSTNSFHNILQPTVLSNSSTPTSSSTIKNTITHSLNPLLKSTQSMAFNYKDFEDDTSSPFDNIELKTINDLDVLAQVLHNTQLKANAENNGLVSKNENGDDDTKTVADNYNESSKMDGEQMIAGQQIQPVMFINKIHHIPKHTNLPKFSYDLGNLNSAQEARCKLDDYTSTAVRYNNTTNNHSPSMPTQTFIGHQQEQQYYGMGNINYYNNMNPLQTNVYALQSIASTNNEGTLDATKWKSVPDILKELRDEVRNSELRRTRNCSHNLGNTSQKVSPVNESSNNGSLDKDEFLDLDSKAKQLAEQISSMGFPKSRVARIVQLLGADDKKIIEHLIPLSELADLGFDENKISEALLRHENNKNRALDDLIS
ncbi:uncharacterized protein LOC106084788 isoform X2 [Stomoxys calcitrans]|uniref:UBA domain-containing protein n=1 Tax=Stomoxys calcitrans TaxID=35570 RepID=A0A1I8Q299_STOCA|nr:uncharacterized protein LOC106084788 isoform X2 [Stomoxys calcitrans]